MNTCSNSTGSAQRIIGLTGGIGMGKTTVSNYLATVRHLPVLDADLYARDAVGTGSPVLAAITDRYGSGILLSDGTLDRHRLGDIIFSSAAERLWLEQQIHPYVRDRFLEAMQTPPLQDPQQYPIVVMVVPLLFEARMTDLVTETWVICCPFNQQVDRLTQRDSLSPEQAHLRINSQMAIQRKIEQADVVLDNSSTLENLFQQIDAALIEQPIKIRLP